MKGEFEKRFRKLDEISSIDWWATVDDMMEIVDNARKEFYAIRQDCCNHPFSVTINRYDDCIEKWFGEECE